MQANPQVEASLYRRIEFESGGIIQNASEQVLKGKAASNEHNIVLSNTWEKVYKIGPGFQNLGNTCFFNSVLQCITYTPSLANYLLSGEHKRVCQRANSFCCICLIEQHVQQCFSPTRTGVIQPRKIIQNMRYINKKFKLGRQDDSHELLRLLLESMQKSALDFKPKVDQKQEESTPIYKIFAGKLKSQVECSQCHYKSENFENFYDISLECKETVEKSLDIFFKKEYLKGNNKYRCSKCKKLVEASKGYIIQTLPNILTLQIKRFNNFMMKINQHITFPAELNLEKYTQSNSPKEEMYDLYGALVHIGGGLHYGHYYCYVKNSNNMWYCMNDSSVTQKSFQEISRDKPYLLFYSKRETIQKPRRKSSAELNQNILKDTNDLNVEPQIQPNKQIDSKEKQNKTLKEEYADSLKTDEYKDHMKKLELIFSIKNEKKESNLDKQIKPKVEENSKKNEDKQEENVDANISEENQLTEYPRLIRSENYINNSKFRVVKLKRLHKLEYMVDCYIRKKIKIDSLPRLYQESDKQIELHNENNQTINDSENKIKQLEQNKKEVQEEKANNQPQKSNVKPGLLLQSLSQKAETSSTSNALLISSSQATNPKKMNISALEDLSKNQPQMNWNLKETAQIQLGKNAVLSNNKNEFEYATKTKDEYDVEYDKGKTKKIKKKKEKQRIDFNKLFTQNKKQSNKNGYSKSK